MSQATRRSLSIADLPAMMPVPQLALAMQDAGVPMSSG